MRVRLTSGDASSGTHFEGLDIAVVIETKVKPKRDLEDAVLKSFINPMYIRVHQRSAQLGRLV